MEKPRTKYTPLAEVDKDGNIVCIYGATGNETTQVIMTDGEITNKDKLTAEGKIKPYQKPSPD